MSALSLRQKAEKALETGSLFEFVNDELIGGKNMSIRGVAVLGGVSKTAIIDGGHFKSQKLAKALLEHGFHEDTLVESGFPPKAVWLTLEYFAYDSKAKAPMAKKICRSFGSFGVQKAFEEVAKAASPALPQTTIELKLGHGPEALNSNVQILRRVLTHYQDERSVCDSEVNYATVLQIMFRIGIPDQAIGIFQEHVERYLKTVIDIPTERLLTFKKVLRKHAGSGASWQYVFEDDECTRHHIREFLRVCANDILKRIDDPNAEAIAAARLEETTSAVECEINGIWGSY